MIFSALAAAIIAALTPNPLPTPQSLPIIALHAPKATLHVQVARTEPQRERGLMSVRHLTAHTGMLFIFDSDTPVAFWMKDTLIPLDMVFISQQGVVRKVFARVAVVSPQLPDAQIPLEQGAAKFVIELPSGEAALDGLQPGTRVEGLP
ncbi:MAG TPA: DUF192 domain-containing protein [Candidatus Baltobacteraceae bacterium]|nr:DUF192 domain-containing protein [Candidatus Baltobacteraceae bacterium]